MSNALGSVADNIRFKDKRPALEKRPGGLWAIESLHPGMEHVAEKLRAISKEIPVHLELRNAAERMWESYSSNAYYGIRELRPLRQPVHIGAKEPEYCSFSTGLLRATERVWWRKDPATMEPPLSTRFC